MFPRMQEEKLSSYIKPVIHKAKANCLSLETAYLEFDNFKFLIDDQLKLTVYKIFPNKMA